MRMMPPIEWVKNVREIWRGGIFLWIRNFLITVSILRVLLKYEWCGQDEIKRETELHSTSRFILNSLKLQHDEKRKGREGKNQKICNIAQVCENLYLLAQQKTNEIIMSYCSRALCAISATIYSEMFNERQHLHFLISSLGRFGSVSFSSLQFRSRQSSNNDDGFGWRIWSERDFINRLSFTSLGSNTMRKTITKQKATTDPLGNFLIRTFEFYGRFSLTLPTYKIEEEKNRKKAQKSVSKSPAKLKGSILRCCTMKRGGKRERGRVREVKTANMQKRPRETYKIPVKSRSALNECVLNLKNEMKRFRKVSHTKNEFESRVNHQNERIGCFAVDCLMWITSERGRGDRKKRMMN